MYLIKCHNVKTYCRLEVNLHVFLTSATGGERAPGTRWIGGWEGPRRVGKTAMVKNIAGHWQNLAGWVEDYAGCITYGVRNRLCYLRAVLVCTAFTGKCQF